MGKSEERLERGHGQRQRRNELRGYRVYSEIFLGLQMSSEMESTQATRSHCTEGQHKVEFQNMGFATETQNLSVGSTTYQP